MKPLTDTLCLQCGLCCNGVLFADVRRGRGDPSALFKWNGPRVPQPCPAFNGKDCTCNLYDDRPRRCRKFECKQLMDAKDGTTTIKKALAQISTARKLAAKVEGLLTELGYNDVELPLSKRFQICQAAAENGALPRDSFDTLADLQLAVHELTILLAKEFYS
jgi:Fe-S-cluster containining protein